MELEKGTLVTINGTNKFIGIISSISSDMEINFKALLRIDKIEISYPSMIILPLNTFKEPVYLKPQMRNLISLDWNWNTLELP